MLLWPAAGAAIVVGLIFGRRERGSKTAAAVFEPRSRIAWGLSAPSWVLLWLSSV